MKHHLMAAASATLLLGGIAHAADTGPITIGVPVGLSGANSVVAPSVVQEAQLAVDEINGKGGVLGRKLALEVADDASGAAGALKAFDSLIYQKKVDALISMETSAARNAGLPAVSKGKVPSSTPRSTRGTPATGTCSSTPGCPSSRCRRSSTTSSRTRAPRPTS